jgi:catechol-2,3-dioxygenase
MNIWHSGGSGPAPAGFAGLRFYTIEMPSEAARAAVIARVRAAGRDVVERDGVVAIQDPWRNTILLTLGAANTEATKELRVVAEHTPDS